MLSDLIVAAAERGLHVHPDKSKVLTNAWVTSTRKVPQDLKVGDSSFEVLDHDGSIKYLGRKVSCCDPHEVELSNRMAAAWATFSKHKEELTDRRYALKDRLRLFSATVTACALYSCEVWALRQDQQGRLRTTQRKMLRMVLNAKRHVAKGALNEDGTPALEPWGRNTCTEQVGGLKCR